MERAIVRGVTAKVEELGDWDLRTVTEQKLYSYLNESASREDDRNAKVQA